MSFIGLPFASAGSVRQEDAVTFMPNSLTHNSRDSQGTAANVGVLLAHMIPIGGEVALRIRCSWRSDSPNYKSQEGRYRFAHNAETIRFFNTLLNNTGSAGSGVL